MAKSSEAKSQSTGEVLPNFHMLPPTAAHVVPPVRPPPRAAPSAPRDAVTRARHRRLCLSLLRLVPPRPRATATRAPQPHLLHAPPRATGKPDTAISPSPPR